jgi:hypothetical protein
MRCDVVEGEPGIFPEPIARFMRAIGGVFGAGRRERPDEDRESTGETGGHGETGGPGETADPDAPATDDKP